MIRRFAAATALLAALAACARSGPAMSSASPPPARAFTLTDQYGKRVTVAQRGGEPAALYFGFTHCKDVCPQTLEKLSRARRIAHLSPAQLRIVMVTVDPKRDTPAALRAYASKLGVDALLLTGSERELRGIYRDYGVGILPQTNDIAHTDDVYLIDGQGRLAALIAPETAAKTLARRLRAL